jgi:hypothetical protein
VALHRPRPAAFGAAGAVAGTAVAFLAQGALRARIEALPDSASANLAVVAFLVLWLGLAAGGAAFGARGARGRPAGVPAPRGIAPRRGGRDGFAPEASGEIGSPRSGRSPERTPQMIVAQVQNALDATFTDR